VPPAPLLFVVPAELVAPALPPLPAAPPEPPGAPEELSSLLLQPTNTNAAPKQTIEQTLNESLIVILVE
jgi:hypothetical protein